MSFHVGFRCLLSVMVLVAALGGGPVASASAAPATERWHRSVPGAWFLWSSPAVADVNGDGGNDVVVGALNGLVYAWDAAGNALPGWPARAIAAVASSPGVGDLDGDGANEVVVGGGSLEAEVAGQQGGVSVFNRDGTLRCNFATSRKHGESRVFNAPAIGDVDGDGLNDVVFGSFDHGIYVLDRTCRQLASFDNTDSVFSAPALHDVDGDRTAEVFIGGDATRGPGNLATGATSVRSSIRAEHWSSGGSGPAPRRSRTPGRSVTSTAMAAWRSSPARAPTTAAFSVGVPTRTRCGPSISMTAPTCPAGRRQPPTPRSWLLRRSAISTVTVAPTSWWEAASTSTVTRRRVNSTPSWETASAEPGPPPTWSSSPHRSSPT